MFGQLNNQLHYKSLQSDLTSEHLALVDSWYSKWLEKGTISPEVAKWVLNNLEVRPGVAFGNIKAHKTGNPFSFITSCCVRQLKTYRPLLNSIYNQLPENFHRLEHH